MTVHFESVKNPVYVTADKKLIDCEVEFQALGEEYVPFTASPDDSEEYGREIYAQCIAGKWGAVRAYVVAVKSQAQLIADATAEKSQLQSEAEGIIVPLERALRLGMATAAEKKRLEAWEKYSVLLSRVDTGKPADIEWPQNPAA